ncbi:TadE/TadG family type IV pilus assembly protein [Sphingomonas bacterium]|uniref:TadE/TadG family type IV pilus assembly protein n=1 Tax=Sphingomonas bacterium TaxID=1895847 RepID=UPI00157639A1|nr:TadE/TadG family type IV pilus assembly protein [Sphingomonas bacterium]
MIVRVLHLARDRRGGAVVEFALVCPVLLILLLGLGDLAFQGYMQDVLTGAVQKAGRDATIQGNAQNTSAIDARVMVPIKAISSGATFVSSRENFDTYSAIAPEPFTDGNGNGIHDAGECYSDVNGNNQWDADPGSSGQGGASDIALYKMAVTYRRLFPLGALLGWGSTLTISASTILKNQPYATQTTTTVKTVCN